MNKDFSLLVIGALISLGTAICLQIIQLVLNNFQKDKGKVKIYCKSVYSKFNSKAWGISRNDNEKYLSIPLWIEIQNTKGRNEIVRDINLILFKGNMKKESMQQISHWSQKNQVEYYGDMGNYSFMLGPESIKRYDLQFTVKKSDLNKNFDRIKIRYFDSKDQYKEYLLYDCPDGWETINGSVDNEWRRITK